MKLITAAGALITVLAGLGCEDSGYTLSIHHDGLHLATVTYLYSYEAKDEVTGDTFTDSGGKTVDLKPGQTLTETIEKLETLSVEVVRQGDGAVVFQQIYGPEDFKGPDNELKIVVRP